mgnify:CR=1 FL=1
MAEPHGQLMRYKKRRRRPSLFLRLRGGRRPGGEQVLRLRARDGAFRAPARVTFFCCQKKVTKENHLDLRSKDPWRGAGFAAAAASRFPPDGEAASGGHISFCEERNVGKKVA